MQVGVTGGIGAGKSIVCRIFGILGIPVYQADSRAKQLMEESVSLREQIIAAFGDKSYFPDGALNRNYLAELVFPDDEQVRKLNQLVHPEVAKDYDKWVHDRENQYPYVIKEAALLIETGSYQDLDFLISVVSPEEIRIARVLVRDLHRGRTQVESIIAQQVSDAERIEKSDIVLYNDESESLIRQILDLHHSLLKQIGWKLDLV